MSERREIGRSKMGRLIQQDTSETTIRAINRNSTSVSKSILRGRAALEEAENHIKLFEDYLRQSSQEDVSHDFEMGEDSGKEQSNLCSQPLIDNDTFTESTPQSNCMTSVTKSLRNDYNMEIDLLNKMMKEEDQRRRRDNTIIAAHSESNMFGLNRQRPDRKIAANRNGKMKRKGPFDPRNLAVAKRAVVKATIMAEDIAHSETEMKKKSEFKARPMPGGNFVKNDPYALTKAALGKVSQVHGSDNSAFASPTQSNRVDASSLLNRSRPSSRISNRLLNTPQNQNHSRKSEIIKKAVYDQISDMIVTSHDNLDDIDADLSSQEEQDLASLHHEISKLKANLNLRRSKCIETIKQIDDHGNISHFMFNENAQPSNNKDDTFSELCQPLYQQDKCFGNISNDGIIIQSPKKVSNHRKICHKQNRENNNKEIGDRSTSLYDRHHVWLQMREAKRMEAKEREDKDLVKGVTGKPNLHGAQESWIKAKQQHDELMKSNQSKDKLLKAEKIEKERLLRDKHVAEIEKLKGLAKEKNRAGKRGIDKRVQSESIDKLARPNSRLKVECKIKPEQLLDQSIKMGGEEFEARKVTETDANKNKDVDLSFADMDDKEFAKMIRKLKAKASKGKRTVFGNQENNVSQTECNNIRKIEIQELEESSDEAKEGDLDNKNENENGRNEYGQGRFTSSIAQAKMLAEISDIKNESNQRNNDNEVATSLGKPDSQMVVKQIIRFPYERYEVGDVPFFDRSSSSEKGRFRVRDAREFHADSLRRISVPFHTSSSDGIMFLVGRKVEGNPDKEEVVTILFNRSQFDEMSAVEWWQLNRQQII